QASPADDVVFSADQNDDVATVDDLATGERSAAITRILSSVPAQPVVVRGGNSENRITIKWDAVSSAVTPVNYTVLVDGEVKVSGTMDLSYTLTPCDKGAYYDFKVYASSPAGDGPVSDNLNRPCGRIPGPTGTPRPRGADCLANPKWIAFEWDPPEDDGGFPLRGYKILRAPESDPFNWQPIDPVSGVAVHQTNFTDKFTGSLVFGQYYSYRVVAMNGIDDLDHSNASEPLVALCTTPPASPAAPTRDYPPHSRTAVTVYWRQVSGADGYRVYAKRDDYEAVSLIYDGMGLGGRLNFTHANLEAGVVYTYWLTALSAASESGWSLPLVAVAAELSGPPSVVPPERPQDFRWQYPEDDGGTP
ncbi:Myosin-binding protein C, slow-type, partial [Perkinsus olseni]